MIGYRANANDKYLSQITRAKQRITREKGIVKVPLDRMFLFFRLVVRIKREGRRQVTLESKGITRSGEMRVLRTALNLRDGTRSNGILRM